MSGSSCVGHAFGSSAEEAFSQHTVALTSATPAAPETSVFDPMEQFREIYDCFRAGQITEFRAVASIVTCINTRIEWNEPRKQKLFDESVHVLNVIKINTVSGRLDEPPRGRASGSSKLKRQTPSNGATKSSPDIEDSGRLKKRSRIQGPEIPSHEVVQASQDPTRASCAATQRLLDLYNRNLPFAKQSILESSRDIDFPFREWDNVIRGLPVNLDAVLASLRPTCHFDEEGPFPEVGTSGEWLAAWSLAAEATAFAFPHREKELRKYGQFIAAEFACRPIATHYRVLNYDLTMRCSVGGGQGRLLPNPSWMQRLSLHVFSTVVDEAAADSPLVHHCRRFNSARGCPNSAGKCQYRHACAYCKRTGHGKETCLKRTKRNSSSLIAPMDTEHTQKSNIF